jgi:hypothetical protein
MMKISALLIAAGFICVAVPAQAGPCTKEIDMVMKFINGGGGSAASLGSAASSASSMNSTSALSAVTGGGSAAGALGSGTAASAASPEALSAVDQAKTADAAGDETSCMEYIGKAKQLLGMVQ